MTDVVGARGREVREVDVGAGEEMGVGVCVCVVRGGRNVVVE